MKNIQAVRFKRDEDVDFPGKGEMSGITLKRIPHANEQPSQHEMLFDPVTQLLSIRHLTLTHLPVTLVSAHSIRWMHEWPEEVAAPVAEAPVAAEPEAPAVAPAYDTAVIAPKRGATRSQVIVGDPGE